jgi:hypothetical protein
LRCSRRDGLPLPIKWIGLSDVAAKSCSRGSTTPHRKRRAAKRNSGHLASRSRCGILPACQKFCLGFLQRGPAPARDDPVLRVHVHRDGPEPAQLGLGISVLIQAADGMAILNDDVIEPVAIGRGRQAGRRRVSIGLGFMGGEPSVNKVPVFSPRRCVVFESCARTRSPAITRFSRFQKSAAGSGGRARCLSMNKSVVLRDRLRPAVSPGVS